MTVRVAIYAFMALTGSCAVISLLEAIGAYDVETARVDGILVFISTMLFASAVITVLGFLAVGMWIYRAHANLRLAGAEGLEFSPGWAVGWYFVPIAQLFKPFQAMRELWSASLGVPDRYGDAPGGSLPQWWAGWIAGNVLSLMSMRLYAIDAASAALIIDSLDVLANICFVASAWFLLQIVEEVSRAQQSSLGMAEAFA